ncbi:MAG: polyprenyl synthetase family protein, partial [Thalassobaculaceae bacterium]
MSDLDSALAAAAADVERLMDVLLPTTGDAEAPLIDAMRYASLGGGKRLRAFLAMQSARLFGVDPRCATRVAAAIEFMHAYSLIHDDLPAMDDSDLRRGRPSCHKAFDESTAILAGDALQALAFEILTDEGTHERAGTRLQLVRELAHAVGVGGMAGGQMIDMIGETKALDMGAITRLQRMKTGELFAFSAGAGATLGQAGPRARAALRPVIQAQGTVV